MEKHTEYSLDKDWSMQRVVPYLLKYYFKEKPTSKKDLVEAFHKLMGKNVKDKQGRLRWTEEGVPKNIHQLTYIKKRY